MSLTVLFLCPHAAAKSVIATADFRQLAEHYGLDMQALAAGTEPDEKVSPVVVELLRAEGQDVSAHQPRRVTAEALAAAQYVISMGCDVSALPMPTPNSFTGMMCRR